MCGRTRLGPMTSAVISGAWALSCTFCCVATLLFVVDVETTVGGSMVILARSARIISLQASRMESSTSQKRIGIRCQMVPKT